MIKKYFFCAFLGFSQISLVSGQVRVTFKTAQIPASKDLSVHLFVAGDFNGWNPANKSFEMAPDNQGTFSVTETLSPGIYNFKITRGDWQKVECTATGQMKGNRSAAITH